MFAIDFGVIYPFLEHYGSGSVIVLILTSTISWILSPIIDCDVTWKKEEDMKGYKEKARVLIMMLPIAVLTVQQTSLSFNYELLISGVVASLNIVLLLFAANIKKWLRLAKLRMRRC